MPKNIVICCDGTGNEFEDNNSNVVKLYGTLIIDGHSQIGYYHPGVGTMGSPTARNRVEKAWSMLMGLAFGSGILDNIGDAYRYLMDFYEDNDRVFLFGFSRGAYTARALAAVIYMYGLLRPGNQGLIPYILRDFAQKTRAKGGMAQTFEIAKGFKATFSRHCPMHFVGVWDTVSSVSWVWDPLKLPYTARNPDMVTGRHAVSIDERRCYYRNNLWGDPYPEQDIKQLWFAGVHSDVGGSYPELQSGLSKITLEWMLQEATAAGLLIDASKADAILGISPLNDTIAPNPKGCLHKSLHGLWWILEFLPHSYYDYKARKKKWRIPRGARRAIPEGSVVHSSVVARMQAKIGYSPENLPKNYTVDSA